MRFRLNGPPRAEKYNEVCSTTGKYSSVAMVAVILMAAPREDNAIDVRTHTPKISISLSAF